MSVASVLSLKRDELVEMFREMGFQTADRWNDEKLMKRVQDLPRMMTEESGQFPEPESESSRQLLASIRQASDDELEMELEPVHHNNGAVTAAKKGGRTKGVQASKGKGGKVEKKSGKEKAKLDKFGSRLGTKTAMINEKLSAKAKSMTQLVQEAGLEGTYYNHLNALVEKGLLIKTEDGYKIKK